MVAVDSTLGSPLTGDHPANPNERKAFRSVFFHVAPAMFLGTIDQTIVATALPTIAGRLHGFTDVAWVVTSYMLAATVAAPIYGRLGDALGRRRALVWALVLFVIGSAACSSASTISFLIAARGLQGLGGGGLMTLALALLGEVVSPKERGRSQGWFGAIFALASALGPLAGGFLTEHLGWRSIFLINLPLGMFAGLTAWTLVPRPGAGRFAIDLPGTCLFITATLALLLGLTFGPSEGWLSPLVWAMAAATVASAYGLWRVERDSSDALIDLALLLDPVVWRSVVCVLIFAALLFGALVQLPMFLQLAFGVAPALSGLLLVPLTLAQVIVSTATGYRISRTGHPRLPMALGLSMSGVGFLATAASLSFGVWATCISSVVFGLGLGTTMPAAQTLAQWVAGQRRLGSATAMVTFARSIGGVLGTAVASAILIIATEILKPGLSTQVGGLLTSASTSVVKLSSSTVEIIQAAFRWVLAGLGVMAIFAAVIAWSVPDVDLGVEPNGGSAR